jgi:dephospho-CoA kinase
LYIGLTGNPGSGKSAALEGFAKVGWQTLDADRLCMEVYRDNAGGIRERLQERWGQEIVGTDGMPDRRRVADIVFSQAGERLWLEEQVHPLVRQRAGALAAAATVPVAFAVPLLFEAGWAGDFAAVATVWAREDLRRARLRQRGWSEEEIRRRDAVQWPPDRKLAEADVGLVNNGTLNDLWQQCRELSNQLT